MVRETDREGKRGWEEKKERERKNGLVKNARSTHLEELEKNRLRLKKKKKKILISARTKTKVPIRKLWSWTNTTRATRPTFKSCLCSCESTEGGPWRWGRLRLRLKAGGGGRKKLCWDKCWCDMIGPALSPCHALMISSPPQDLSRGTAKDGHH